MAEDDSGGRGLAARRGVASSGRPRSAESQGAIDLPRLNPGEVLDERALHRELLGMARFIRAAKQEVTAIRAAEITGRDLPLANDELEAIGAHLEDATGTILDSCEAIERGLSAVPADAQDPIQDAVTRIYEACNFQDLTGQRINKIVTTLNSIESRISTIVRAFDTMQDEPEPEPSQPAGPLTDAQLLNGPQLPTGAKRQDEIDALFAGL